MLNTEDNEDHIQSPDRWICTIDEMRPEWSTFDHKGFSKLYMTERGHPLRGATKWRPHAQTYAFKLPWVNFRLSKVNQRDVLETNLSMRSIFRPLNLYGSFVVAISYLTNAEPGVRSCEDSGTYFHNPYHAVTMGGPIRAYHSLGKTLAARLANEENMSLTDFDILHSIPNLVVAASEPINWHRCKVPEEGTIVGSDNEGSRDKMHWCFQAYVAHTA